jgi:hypothetical protein
VIDIALQLLVLQVQAPSGLHLNSIVVQLLFLREPTLLGALRHLQHIHRVEERVLRDQRAPMQSLRLQGS